jgi:hypothetical protein
MKIGVGETVITAPIGTEMRGYRARNSTGVHDELYARSIVLEGKNGISAVLMTLGICDLDEGPRDQIQAMIEEKTGIPADNIIVSCTHTHSGPEIDLTGEYVKFLVEKSAESAVTAWETREPAKIGVESTTVFGLGMNDRRMLHGGIHMDPEVGIIKIENARGKLKGVFFNYGCHPSTLDLHNTLFTEDWPYFSIKGIKDQIGDDVIVGYFQSAQGDSKVGYTAELSAVGADMNNLRSFDFAEKKGSLMTDAVLEKLPSIKTSGDFTIKTASGIFDYPLRGKDYPVRYPEAERLAAAARARLAAMEKKRDTIGKRVLDSYKVDVFLAELTASRAKACDENPDPAPAKLTGQAVLVGDAAFVTFPNEVFTEIGLKVKQSSPFKKTFILGLTCGLSEYIYTEEEYKEGGYAVVGSPFAPACEQVIIKSSLELLNKLD